MRVGRPCKYRCNEQYFEKIISDQQAYILGFMWADAHVNDKNGISITLQPIDEEFLMFFKAELETDTPIKIFKSLGREYSKICLNRKKLIADLNKIGIRQNKSNNNALWPDIPDHLISSFIRGLFDGDGSIWRKGGTSWAVAFSGGYHFLNKIKEILDNKGITCSRVRYRYNSDRPQACMLDITGGENINRIFDYIYTGAMFTLKRKQYKFETAVNEIIQWRQTQSKFNGTKEEIIKLYLMGISQKKISIQLNMGYSAVRAIIQRARKKQEIL